jgi:hypothetical protein
MSVIPPVMQMFDLKPRRPLGGWCFRFVIHCRHANVPAWNLL